MFAFDLASKSLPSTHPTKVGLGLNYSVFLLEIEREPEKALKMTRDCFDNAIADLDNIDDDNFRESTLLMQLLRDNIQLWTSELPLDEIN